MEQVARDEGICVYTQIEDAKTGEIVDNHHLKSGNIYRQRVYISSTRERTFVAVRVPVPAGCEIMNAAFLTTATVPNKEKSNKINPFIYRPSVSHKEIYDSEIRCFYNHLYPGKESFEFLFRAQRKGEYQCPASCAECMYEEEIFGRSSGAVWKIE